MFNTIFFTVLRSIAIPLVAVFIFKDSFLGLKGALLAVCIALTVVNFFTVTFQIIKILPNAVFFKGKRIFLITIKIGIEIISVLGFWIYLLGLPA